MYWHQSSHNHLISAQGRQTIGCKFLVEGGAKKIQRDNDTNLVWELVHSNVGTFLFHGGIPFSPSIWNKHLLVTIITVLIICHFKGISMNFVRGSLEQRCYNFKTRHLVSSNLWTKNLLPPFAAVLEEVCMLTTCRSVDKCTLVVHAKKCVPIKWPISCSICRMS